MVAPDSQATACPPSGRNSTYRPVQISETSSEQAIREYIKNQEEEDRRLEQLNLWR